MTRGGVGDPAPGKKRGPRNKPKPVGEVGIAPIPPADQDAHKRQMAQERAAHKRDEDREDKTLRRWILKQFAILVLLMVAVTFVSCVALMFLPGTTEILRSEAMRGLFALLLALVSFIAGKGTSKGD